MQRFKENFVKKNNAFNMVNDKSKKINTIFNISKQLFEGILNLYIYIYIWLNIHLEKDLNVIYALSKV